MRLIEFFESPQKTRKVVSGNETEYRFKIDDRKYSIRISKNYDKLRRIYYDISFYFKGSNTIDASDWYDDDAATATEFNTDYIKVFSTLLEVIRKHFRTISFDNDEYIFIEPNSKSKERVYLRLATRLAKEFNMRVDYNPDRGVIKVIKI